MFSDDNAIVSYAIVGTLNDGPLKDQDNTDLTVAACADNSGSMECTISGFNAPTNAAAKAGLYISGYVKASDSKG